MNQARPATSPTLTLDTVLCRAGGHLVGLEAALVRGAEAVGPGAARSDDCPARLSGLVAPPGSQTDGVESDASRAAGDRHVLTLRGRQTDWRLLVDGPLDLAQLPAEGIRPLPPLLEARAHPRGLRALTFFRQELVLLLDASLLENEV